MKNFQLKLIVLVIMCIQFGYIWSLKCKANPDSGPVRVLDELTNNTEDCMDRCYIEFNSTNGLYNTGCSSSLNCTSSELRYCCDNYDYCNNIIPRSSLRSNTPYIQSSPSITNWGVWGATALCPANTFAVGFRTKLEKPCGFCDDTALNSIQLICSNNQTIISSEGPWGTWDSSFSRCSSNKRLVGYQIKGEAPQGKGDDTATNAIKMICENNQVISSLEGPWGYWTQPTYCPLSNYICGVITQVEPRQGLGDDSAMNNVRFLCCQ